MPTLDEVITTLALQPHPEGGWYRETWRAPNGPDGRSLATAIYFLIDDRQSCWHRVDASEMWHFYAGDPMELETIEGDALMTRTLGPSIDEEEEPQLLVPTGAWQRARSLGSFTLAGCTVVPGFEFSGFEVLPDGVGPPTA